ncbi:Uncharacterised protein [Porphyromonas macacae]|uniref:Outer membrane protein assembly factor BamE domain-containing protein n=1 Tax=Porphyromonas macacae TaxID=28115 RepID=A0A379EGM7_9PORP|nr:outer membrane protein assembly factor BamE [Porphyromonas macacae]SUB98071.1 Uncharacterised protein [Porphyromonas macacae]
MIKLFFENGNGYRVVSGRKIKSALSSLEIGMSRQEVKNCLGIPKRRSFIELNDGRKLEKWVYVLHENQEKIADEYFLDFEGDRLVSLDIQKVYPL